MQHAEVAAVEVGQDIDFGTDSEADHECSDDGEAVGNVHREHGEPGDRRQQKR